MSKVKSIDIILVAPSADMISGSLLRPINIWYSLNAIKGIHAEHVPIKSVSHLLWYIVKLVNSEIVIVSGVNPWVTAIIVLLRRLFKKIIIVDVHGIAWYEASITRSTNFPVRLMLFLSEFISYKYASYLMVASQWLANKLKDIFNVNGKIYLLENATTYIFESIVEKLRHYARNFLLDILCSRVKELMNICDIKQLIMLAPLPDVFKSNILAHNMLLKLSNKLPRDTVVIVTGYNNESRAQDNIIYLGYLTYPEYVALLLASDAVFIPYPKNAIAGGARNKILEAGYCGKPVITTFTGMIHINAKPMIHYIPLENLKLISDVNLRHEAALGLSNLIYVSHNFKAFKARFLKYIISMILR